MPEQQPDIQRITSSPLTNPDGSQRIIVSGLGTDNRIYTWQWKTGSWKLDAKGDDGGAF